MNTTKKLYFGIVLLFTFLLYDQGIGLNMLCIALISSIYYYIINKNVKQLNWWLASSFWIGSGIGLFIEPTALGLLIYTFTAFNFFSINANQNFSFPFTIIHSFFSFIVGLIRFVTPKKKDNSKIEVITNKLEEVNLSEKQNNKWMKLIFLIGIPLVLVFVFLKLYQIANPTFAEYTAFINLKFIEWQFILTYGALLFLLYGFYLFNSQPISEQWDLGKKNSIASNYSDSVQKNIGIATEHQMAKTLLIVLNCLLLAFICIDGLTLFTNQMDSELSHSQNVHLGINILILSIILVIIIIGLIYRGGLNFIKKNKTIKVLTTIWLFLNFIITIFNGVKNYNYISEWGLTEKRIGVFIYLLLCVFGLTFTLYKILNKKSFIFLIRRVSYSFVATLVVYSMINWTPIIVKYNLSDSHFNESKIDFHYNVQLGQTAYPLLLNYFEKHPQANNWIYNMVDYKTKEIIETNLHKNWKNTPSITWSDLSIKVFLKNYKPLKVNTFEPYDEWNY